MAGLNISALANLKQNITNPPIMLMVFGESTIFRQKRNNMIRDEYSGFPSPFLELLLGLKIGGDVGP